ncbi:hypothetical protein BDP81DRAFT_174517 [Colletotrichum phormii]|uniref:Uncharacterized protein n=1 Tax=Colletotrichum phormii TaxID=359342 RepID=A0AAJ0E7F0_9PEZI|nr:uncharacterized protein BDP81DRAFT_174517 [Colletotrichum phormii]KAK1621526.1 hypothetical protein BDP81DRAFT_174517 [Colletotrichum phormii]
MLPSQQLSVPLMDIHKDQAWITRLRVFLFRKRPKMSDPEDFKPTDSLDCRYKIDKEVLKKKLIEFGIPENQIAVKVRFEILISLPAIQ